jgi:hypothetical protein
MTESAVETRLQYLVPTGERPVYYASTGGADAQLRVSAAFEGRTVVVHDGRRLPEPATLDLQGFALETQTTRVEDFYAERDLWQERYENELSELVLGVTGGREIFIFDHTLRSDSSSVRGDRSTREPATVIHNDYTDASAAKRVRDLLPPEQAAIWLAGRFAIINAWRSVAGPVTTTPLACCDASTIAHGDLVASERRAEERIGELELVSWNPAHRWYYYPDMRGDEVLLIKTFDSARDGRATRSIHTAFDNPLAAAGSPPRESIESRTIVYFG